jgi:hypothetical protein
MQVESIVVKIGEKFQPLSIKVSDEKIKLSDGVEVQAIQFVKNDGSEGAVQFWTADGIVKAKQDAELLNLDRAREILRGVDPESI